MGYVYLLLEVDKEGLERHKIGFSKNHPDKRSKQLQTGNGSVITTLRFYESVNYKKIEHMLHKKYYSQKTEANNEWFNLTDENVILFGDDCSKFDGIINYLNENNHFLSRPITK